MSTFEQEPSSTPNRLSYIPNSAPQDHNDVPFRNDYSGLLVSQYQADDGMPIPHPSGSQEWLPAVDLPSVEPPTANNLGDGSVSPCTSLNSQRRASPHHIRSGSPDTQPNTQLALASSLNRAASKRSTFTNSEGRPIAGSTFMNGAGTTGPYAMAEHDETLHRRSASAETSLTPKQKSKIVKREAKDNKQLSKIIKNEGKVEKQALSLAIKELGDLQRFQDAAVKHESKAHAAHSKALAAFKKAEVVYLAAKTEYETTLAHLKAHEEALEKIREGAREATERVQEKSQEVDGLRTMLGVDERERQAKLAQLNGKSKWGFSRN